MYNQKLDLTGCRCKGFDEVIKPVSLAMAYVPKQEVCSLYSPCEALAEGTAFPELNKPYVKPFGAAKTSKTDCRQTKGGMKNECKCR